MLKPGDRAPNFILPDAEGRDVALDDLRGEWVLLFFYPKNGTPVCTAEVCAFRDEFSAYRERGVRLIGVNLEKSQRHKRFIAKHNLPFPLLWDRQKRISRRYGALGPLGLYCRRSYFLIDPEGWIRYAMIERFSIFRRPNADLLAAIDRAQAERQKKSK